MTKAAKQKYQAWLNSKWYDLRMAYDRPSKAKCDIWTGWWYNMQSHNGFGLRVISRNAYHFTCGYCYDVDGERWFRLITPTHISDFKVSELEAV